jgi:hypothetical protein
MNYAPIVLFVYNRPWHTKKTLEALAKNLLVTDSILYIYADGAKENADAETIKKINETRACIKSKKWCKEVIIIERENNLGLANSVISGVTEIVNKHGKIIVLEDDIIVSSGFLQYMNDALNLLSENERIGSITGFGFNTAMSLLLLPTYYFLKRAECWSWATWKRAWNLFIHDANQCKTLLLENKKMHDFNYGNHIESNMLDMQIDGKINSWAIRWHATFSIYGLFTLYPKESLILNIGNDGSGTHYNQTISEIPETEFILAEYKNKLSKTYLDRLIKFRFLSEKIFRVQRTFSLKK